MRLVVIACAVLATLLANVVTHALPRLDSSDAALSAVLCETSRDRDRHEPSRGCAPCGMACAVCGACEHAASPAVTSEVVDARGATASASLAIGRRFGRDAIKMSSGRARAMPRAPPRFS